MATVGELLDRTTLGLVAHHVPHPGAEVRWVATSELDDPAPFLEGGEVLLTTGLNTAGWRREWRAYVDRLAGAGVSAIGLGTGLTHRRPPGPLVRACEELGVNLVEVPRATTFVAVSRVVATLVEQREQLAARKALETQRRLALAALSHDDPAGVLARLAELVSGEVCTMTREGRIEHGPYGDLELLDIEAVQEEVRRLLPQGLRAASSLSHAGTTTVVQPVGVTGRPSSYVAVLVHGRPTEAQRSAVMTAVALLGLSTARSDERRDTSRRLRSRAIELLVQGDARTAAIVLGAATSGQRVRLPSELQVLRAAGAQELVEDGFGALEAEDLLAGLLGTELCAVVAPRRADATAAALADAGLQVGVGGLVSLEEARQSHESAGHALAVATEASPVVRWDQLVGEGALALVDPERAAAFAVSYLEGLGGSGELMDTLQSFLRHHGSRGSVAAELGIHRNTVRNRIEQIEAAIGGSLDDPQVRVNAWVALHAGTRAGG